MEKKLLQNNDDDQQDDNNTASSPYSSSQHSPVSSKHPHLKPMSNIEVIEELNNLRSALGIKKTDNIDMCFTREIVKTKGSLLDVWDDMKQRERQ
jgi:hypothetical protein